VSFDDDPIDDAEGGTMPEVELEDWPPAGPRHGDIGYVSLWVPDVEQAADFFAAVLGWRYGPASGPNGRRVEGRDVHHGLWGGEERATLFCCFAVADVAEAAERVRVAGGTASEPHQEPFGMVVEGVDDQGIRFAAYQPPDGVGRGGAMPANGRRHGDVAYVTMEVVDAAKARAFYGHVLGWQFAAGHIADGWRVHDVAPMVGLSGGHDVATTWAMYRVDDIGAVVDAVRDAGGTATDPAVQPYGVTSICTDDQGTRFSVGQF
jgi:predicted enzyme related to lactoylglutathione lyase